MKTIFVTIFQGVEAKNILRTGVVAKLLEKKDVRVVCLVASAERAAFYQDDFSDPRLIYEVVQYRAEGLLERILSKLKFQLLRTRTTDLRRRMNADISRNYFGFIIGSLFNRLVARRVVRKFVRWIDLHLIRDTTLRALYDHYQPDCVFLAHLFDDGEIALLREAKKRNIPSIGFINSWDKLTARCTIRLLPDTLLVYSAIVKSEAMAHVDLPASRIHIVGIPQYDFYYNYEPHPRDEFMRRIGIDTAKRFILYAPMGETFSTSDWQMIDLLHQWLSDGTLPADVDLLVRFQPNDSVNETEVARRAWLHSDRPGKRFSRSRGVDWDMSGAELRHLADTLAYTSLLICYASSMSVDAAMFDKPVININFEFTKPRHLMQSPTQFYQMEHYENALQSGGIRLVNNKDELRAWILRYLEHPEFDLNERRRLVRVQCGQSDGHASELIAEEIVATLN